MEFSRLAEMIHGELAVPELGGRIFEGASIDSRTLETAQLFIAIKGENQDGHQYINDALARQASGLMISKDFVLSPEIYRRIPVVKVPDTHQAMKILANLYAQKINATIIVITGSNGKTTTKEFTFGMVNSISPKSYRSPGNLNNLYGLPLAIFRMPDDCRYGVFEYGISEPGEMTGLAQIMMPSLAVITNVGPTHLETLGSIAGVAEAKLELADYMDNTRPVLINADDAILMVAARRRSRQFITFGIEHNADITARYLGLDDAGFPHIDIDGQKIKLRLFGRHQAYNLLAGYAACKTLGLAITPELINQINFEFAPYRGQIEDIDGLTIIADCYNANPASMTSGLSSFAQYVAQLRTKHRAIAVVGDMLELGRDSQLHHEQIGQLLARLNFDLTLAVGPASQTIVDAARAEGLDKNKILYGGDTADGGAILMKNIQRGDMIYFKASRGIALEKIIAVIKKGAFGQN